MPSKKVHMGQEMEKALRASGRKLSSVARLMDVDRSTLYDMFDKENVNLKHVSSLGRVLKHDFSKVIPEVKDYLEKSGEASMVEEGASVYEGSLAKCLKDKKDIEKKYVAELERTNMLLRNVILDLYQSLNLKPSSGLNLDELRG